MVAAVPRHATTSRYGCCHGRAMTEGRRENRRDGSHEQRR